MRSRSVVAFLLTLSFLGAGSAVASAKTAGDPAKDHKSTPQKPAAKPPPAKPPAKAPEKPAAKPAEKPAEKPAAKPFAIGSEVDSTLTMTDAGGKAISMKDLRGKIVVVQFWSMTSNAYDKRIAALATEYAAKGVTFIAIDADKPDCEDAKKLQEHATKNGITFSVVPDAKAALADRFGAQTSSHAFVIDAKGMLRYSGAIDDDPKGEKGDKAAHHLKGALDALIAGKDVATPTTTANGNPIARAAAGKPPAH
jgi:peroxiredoxin